MTGVPDLFDRLGRDELALREFSRIHPRQRAQDPEGSIREAIEAANLKHSRHAAVDRLAADGYTALYGQSAWWQYPERALDGHTGAGAWWDHAYIVLGPDRRPIYAADPYLSSRRDNADVPAAMLGAGWRFETSRSRTVHYPGRTIAWWLYPPRRTDQEWADELRSIMHISTDPDVLHACGLRLIELGRLDRSTAADLSKCLFRIMERTRSQWVYDVAQDHRREVRRWHRSATPPAPCPTCGRLLASTNRVRLADGSHRHESCLRPGDLR
jgi:hypothetical protein